MADAQANLQQGVTYRGRILAFSPIGVSEEKVKTGFQGVGFKDVLVWMDASDLPADWPKEARQDVSDATQTQAWVQGTWDKPSGSYPAHGSMWTLYDYWPKDQAKPVQVDVTQPASTTNWKLYGIVAGVAAVTAVVLIVASSKE